MTPGQTAWSWGATFSGREVCYQTTLPKSGFFEPHEHLWLSWILSL